MQTDLEVEIAQESAIAEPMVEPLLLGQSLNVTPLLCPDEKNLALFGLFTWREKPQHVTAVDCGARDVKSVETAVFAAAAGSVLCSDCQEKVDCCFAQAAPCDRTFAFWWKYDDWIR